MPQTSPPPHGTRSRYVRHRCRCDACRSANAAYGAARHRKRTQAVAALSRRDDLELLADVLTARRRELHTLEATTGPHRGALAAARAREITRTLELIDAIAHHRDVAITAA